MDYWRLSFKLFSIPVNRRLDKIWTPSKVTRARTGYSRSDGTLEMLPARARGSGEVLGRFLRGRPGSGRGDFAVARVFEGTLFGLAEWTPTGPPPIVGVSVL